ncbi:MAG: bifunctional isocitrate dehydrogenase kinase/phosphatase [Candidatus Accumulibacter sp.]|uniref:Bifunctional isocitrate dehydrogenase kinase/phosphatase n=1 Tax=Candidatus Accumulibacter proximus TaxID=2954385 RepID=A0A935PZ54_9PROT|nr:bifunctional isocitrate dehydrogenase kinase/phosphatase [Candidatus Accumulibacter proximus]
MPAFLSGSRKLRSTFLKYHRALLDGKFWQSAVGRIRAGHVEALPLRRRTAFLKCPCCHLGDGATIGTRRRRGKARAGAHDEASQVQSPSAAWLRLTERLALPILGPMSLDIHSSILSGVCPEPFISGD